MEKERHEQASQNVLNAFNSTTDAPRPIPNLAHQHIKTKNLQVIYEIMPKESMALMGSQQS